MFELAVSERTSTHASFVGVVIWVTEQTYGPLEARFGHGNDTHRVAEFVVRASDGRSLGATLRSSGIRAGATASHRDLSDCRRALGVRRRSRPRLGGRGPHATFPERWSSRGPSLREMRRAGDAYEMIRVVPEHQLVLKRIVSLQALADVPDVVAATDQRLPGENSSLGRGSTPGLGGVRPGATSCRRCGQRAGRRNACLQRLLQAL